MIPNMQSGINAVSRNGSNKYIDKLEGPHVVILDCWRRHGRHHAQR
jgi:hypothetical protein